jgi:hypothetical protein
MSAAQKAAQANFKKAIAYRKKTGCTLKQAFAHVKSGKVGGLEKVVKKGSKTTVLYSKKAKKKAAPKKKASQGVLFGTKKPSEKAILKKVHSAKTTSKTLFNKLDKLDEAQHAHMSIGNVKNKMLKEVEDLQILINEQKNQLNDLINYYKKSKSKINKQMAAMDIKTLKTVFIPYNTKRLKSLQIALKNSI